ncbi:MAG: hypothetical protein PHG86_06250 [Candidatus Methanomethylophilaceae archaeon]|nr:hypothetical protein [Candidatus Methanomethylophilaceae archaeon]
MSSAIPLIIAGVTICFTPFPQDLLFNDPCPEQKLKTVLNRSIESLIISMSFEKDSVFFLKRVRHVLIDRFMCSLYTELNISFLSTSTSFRPPWS